MYLEIQCSQGSVPFPYSACLPFVTQPHDRFLQEASTILLPCLLLAGLPLSICTTLLRRDSLLLTRAICKQLFLFPQHFHC